MAVSLKKCETVDLSKPEIPPKIREYTPEHLIDEAETILRPRQPPIPPQHSNELELFLEENGIKVTDDGDVRSKREDEINAHYHSLFVRSVIAVTVFCVTLLIIFLVGHSSPRVSSGESVPTESISDVVTSVASSESVSSGDVSRAVGSYFEIFRSAFSYIFHSPACLIVLGLSALSLIIRLAQNIIKMGRYK